MLGALGCAFNMQLQEIFSLLCSCAREGELEPPPPLSLSVEGEK
jgi:hypothetical protein